MHVDRAYLTLPIDMLLTSILYVILTTMELTRLEVPIWKEKALPMLLYGFHDETKKLPRVRKKRGNRERGSKSRVRL